MYSNILDWEHIHYVLAPGRSLSMHMSMLLFTHTTLRITLQNSPAQFWSDFQGNLSSLSYNRSEALRQSRFVYDAVWAAAYALHNTSELLRNGVVRNTSMTLDNFTDVQFREEINRVILESTRSLKFRGVSVSEYICEGVCV